MAETIMTPVLVRANVGRGKDGSILNEYKCVECGIVRAQKAWEAARYPKCRSCGRKVHGLKSDPRLHVWSNMRDRATNSKRKDAGLYAGRGIGICDEWMTFQGFMRWKKFNDYKPGLQIDRIDNDKGYCPDNCRWATPAENARNRRSAKLTAGDIRAIRMLCWSGVAASDVANVFSVRPAHIRRIMRFCVGGDV